MSVESIRRYAELFLERLGWVLLALIMYFIALYFGMTLVGWGIWGIEEMLGESFSYWSCKCRPLLPGIELTIVPLSAIFAAWLRPGADRIRALRETRAGPWLPLLMAAALAGLCAWLVWSWHLPQASFGPDQFGYARWLGTALAAAFTIFWLPLFPRLTAILAGMITGPAVSASIGYIFFGSSPILMRFEGSDGPCSGGGCHILAFLVVTGLSLLLLRSNIRQAHPLKYAAVVGALAGLLAV